MPSTVIQWFPGHMAKTRRMMADNLPLVDAVIQLLDARIPGSSENPEIRKICGGKPLLTVLNKASLADPGVSGGWVAHFKDKKDGCILADCKTGDGLSKIVPALRELLADKLQRYADKGMTGRRIRAMVVGIPNVGKSTLINRLSGTKKAKAEDRPGVTVQKQWVQTADGLDLLDMPGVLWPKFEDQRVGAHLAMTGAIKDQILDINEIAVGLCGILRERYPALFASRYRLSEIPDREEMPDWELFALVGRKRGFLISGGEVDYDRTASVLLDEFRGGKIGRITLELPGESIGGAGTANAEGEKGERENG